MVTIKVEIGEILAAGIEMISYKSAIKAAEMLDTSKIDEFERNSILLDSLKRKCDAKGVIVENVKWGAAIQPYVNARLNLHKEKNKALCKNFMPAYHQAMAEFNAFMQSEDDNAAISAYDSWCRKHSRVINAAKILAHEVSSEDYPETLAISDTAKDFLDDVNSRIKEINERLEQERQKRLLAIQQIQPVEGHKLDEQQINCILEDAHNHLVIAGAGTGKTTTIVGLVKYLLKSEICASDEILMLSFTNKSAAEMQLRIKKETGIDMDIFTFHKLGTEIIRSVEGKKCSVYSAGASEFARQSVKKHLEDEAYRRLMINYCIYSPSKSVSEFDFKSKQEYDEYIRNSEPVTIKGERVKSYCELEIANFFYSNGINYTYEKLYEHDLADDEYSGYYPDFYLDDYGIYVEFFAVDQNGKVPDWFTADGGKTPSETYIEKIVWKREIHKKYNTKFVEVSYADKQSRRLLENLQSKLEAMGVVFVPKSDEELWNDIKRENNAVLSNVVNVIGTIISLVKSGGYTLEQIMGRSIFMKFIPILKLTEPVYNDYAEMLKTTGQIDFNDMIHYAADYVSQGKYAHKYKYVIVDEYQDMSKARYKLLYEMRRSADFKLFCVGDDWQSIYRFTGSDVGYILNFEKYWGPTTVSKIETTYRFGNALIQITGQFIMKNPAQIRKELHSRNADMVFPLEFVEAYTDKLLIKFAAERIRKLEEGSTVFFIGRYSTDKNMFNDSEFEQHRDNAIVLPDRPDLKMEFITAHKSKGLQADYVFIINNSNSVKGFPSRIQDDPIIQLLLENSDVYPFAEERRLYYVAMTRVRKKVWLLIPQNKPGTFANEFKAAYGHLADSNSKKDTEGGICPKCGGKLVLRRGQFGEFYGCKNYFATGCSYKRSIEKR